MNWIVSTASFRSAHDASLWLAMNEKLLRDSINEQTFGTEQQEDSFCLRYTLVVPNGGCDVRNLSF